MSGCNICNGLGVLEKDSKYYECQCSYIKRIAFNMPPFLRKAEVRKDHLSLPIMKMMKKHLIIVSSWSDMKAIVKALIISNSNKFIKITSDREIRDVFVGAKSRAARGDEDGKIYNSLEDLMDLPDLILIRLNELSYKNKAASGALEEAISYRTDRDKPTWLFNDISKPFMSGSFAYSDSVADLMKSVFSLYRVNKILPDVTDIYEEIIPIEINTKPEPVEQKYVPAPKSSPPPDAEVQVEKPLKKMKIKSSPDEEVDSALSMYGSGLKSKRKF